MPKDRFLTLCIIVVTTILSFLLLMHFQITHAEVVDCCTPHNLPPAAAKFSQDASVVVTIDSRYFNETERQLIEQAFKA